MNWKFLFPIVFLLFISSNILAQQKVEASGRIIDAETKLPVTGVNVMIKDKQIGTVSDDRGYFYLKASQELPFVIHFSMIGFQSEDIIITKKITSGIRIKFKTLSYVGKEIVFIAPVVEVEEKNMRKEISVETLDALGIKETPSPNFYNAIGNLKGVDVVNQSMQFMTVNARGFNSTVNTRFVQIVDGMDNQAPGMNFSIGNIAGLNELDIESIEFLPGPSSARFGGNVLNGLLIMNSKDPFKFQGLSFYVKPGVSDVRAGSDHPFQFEGKGLVDMGFRFAKALGDKLALKVTASYMKGEDWYADDTTNIRPGNIHWEYDPGHDALNKYGDEVISEMPIGKHNENVIVARTGYKDKYLVDNSVFSLKLGGAAHYRLTDKITTILEGNYG
ncbi:MAG: TonB-dependent receptor, partial [Bacteroidetes bacterium]